MVEKTIENKLKNFLKLNNIWFLKTHGGSFQSAGICDLIICNNGKFIAAEIKKWPNKLTLLQESHLIKQKQNNALILVIDQFNIDKIIQFWFDEKIMQKISNESILKYFKNKL